MLFAGESHFKRKSNSSLFRLRPSNGRGIQVPSESGDTVTADNHDDSDSVSEAHSGHLLSLARQPEQQRISLE